MIKSISLQTKGFTDIVDITDKINDVILSQKAESGVANLFVKGSTAGITAIESDPNLYEDLKQTLEEIAPYKKDWKHHQTWHDDNGASHIRAALIGPSVTVPFKNKALIHGTWQKIVVIDFDTTKRNREIIVSIIPDK